MPAMRLSRRSEYGLRALVDLVRHDGDGPLALATLAQRNNLPSKFLEQIMATLKHGGDRPHDAGRPWRLRPGGRSVDRDDRAGHPAARRRPGATPLRLAALLRPLFVSGRGDLPAARRDDRRPRRDARDPRQGDPGRARRPARARHRSIRVVATPMPWPADGPDLDGRRRRDRHVATPGTTRPMVGSARDRRGHPDDEAEGRHGEGTADRRGTRRQRSSGSGAGSGCCRST